uniref:SGNH hydrolase-type esterase domain-containing protein n=1 Tax=Magallana gigas TaxID=29159 RepID=A0A8W8NUD9_MAGGI
MEPNKVLILGHSIVRRFQQFLVSNEDVRYCEDLGLRANHRIFYRGVGGRTISDILREDASFIEKVKPRNIILIVGGNDVRRATSSEELAANIEPLVSVLHNRFGVAQIHVFIVIKNKYANKKNKPSSRKTINCLKTKETQDINELGSGFASFIPRCTGNHHSTGDPAGDK